MAQFPRLRSDAIAQYPATTYFSCATEVLYFVDGREQRFRRSPLALRRWTIDLCLLDEDELQKLRIFFIEHSGQHGTFSFWDPWTEAEYASCRFESDALELSFEALLRGSTTVNISEVRL